MIDEPILSSNQFSSVPQPHVNIFRHPQTCSSLQDNLRSTSEDWRTSLERYCRLFIDIEAPGRSSFQQGRHHAETRSSLSPAALRCASILMLIFASRETESVILTVRDLLDQFRDTILITLDSNIRESSVRRWTGQFIDALNVNMARAREGLKAFSIFLGTRGPVRMNQLKYLELSLAALEFSSLSRLKDKLYVIGKTFFGVPDTQQEFFCAFLQRPLLLKSFGQCGKARASVAKKLLTLFTTLALESQPAPRSTRSTNDIPLFAPNSTSVCGTGDPRMMARSSSLFSTEGDIRIGQVEPLMHWGALANAFPLARWCGLLVCCAAALLEEVASHFTAQERPSGTSGGSRLENYHILLRQTYKPSLCLKQIA